MVIRGRDDAGDSEGAIGAGAGKKESVIVGVSSSETGHPDDSGAPDGCTGPVASRSVSG